MKTVEPAMSLRTSCWLLPQNEQKSVFLEMPPVTLLILAFRNGEPGFVRQHIGGEFRQHNATTAWNADRRGDGARTPK
jgi:hypothetical protein